MKTWQSITASIIAGVIGIIAMAFSSSELSSVQGATQTQATLASSVNSSQYLPLRKGMTYKETRRIILKQGWKPNPDVKTNFRNSGVKAIFDRGYIEINDCSGTGEAPCRYEFVNQNGDILYVVTAGRDSLLKNWWIKRN